MCAKPCRRKCLQNYANNLNKVELWGKKNKISRWPEGRSNAKMKFFVGLEGRSNAKMEFFVGLEGRSNAKMKFFVGLEGRSNAKMKFFVGLRVVPTRK